MRTAYRLIAWLIAFEVLVQAAAIAYAVFGLSTWIQGGGVLDKAGMESETTDFVGVGGFPLHGINGQIVIPVRNGVPATGSPWWVDSLDVADGDSYEIAFVADNPGLWMDHCHNLTHPSEGLTAHLVFEGVGTPYRVGGPAGNDPE